MSQRTLKLFCGGCKLFKRQWPAAAAGFCMSRHEKVIAFCPDCHRANGEGYPGDIKKCSACFCEFEVVPPGLKSELSDACHRGVFDYDPPPGSAENVSTALGLDAGRDSGGSQVGRGESDPDGGRLPRG